MTVPALKLRAQPSSEAFSVAELAQDHSWQVTLMPEHRAELYSALDGLMQRASDRETTAPPRRETFPLPTLGKILATTQRELESGRGVRLLKNFPVDLAEADCRRMYTGLMSHIGAAQPQTITGEFLQPVQDEGQASLDERRGSKHNLGLPIHNDGCDVVGFLCRRTPLSGGETILVSAAAIHNELLAQHPDALAVLYRPFHNAWQDYMYPTGRNTAAAVLPRTWEAPIFSSAAGRLCARYSRFYIDRAQSFAGVPKLSSEQVDALDLLDRYLADADHWQYRRHFAPGDVLLLNNHVVFHSRTQFVNGEDLAAHRQLYRVWLAVPNSRPLAASMACFFGDTTAGAARRGGVKDEFMLARGHGQSSAQASCAD